MRQRLTSGRRLWGVDVARSLALFGMMSVHIFPGTRPDGSLHPSYAIAAGRSAALFAVLAGVGLALATGGQQPYDGRWLLAARTGVLARAALLIGLGLILGQVNSPPLVILAYYGVLFVLAIPFLGLSSRALAALAAASAVLTPVLSYLVRTHLDPAPIADAGGSDLFVELFLTGTYPALTWTTYLFAGLSVGRADLRRASTALWLAVGGAALAIGAYVAASSLLNAAGGVDRLRRSVPSDPVYAFVGDDLDLRLREGFFGVTPTTDWRWLVVAAPHSGTTFDLLATTGTALAVLGVCLLVVARARWLSLALAATGSMTLSLYTAHVLALSQGSRLLVTDDRLDLWLGHVVTAIVLATLWRSGVGRGPLEWVSAMVDRSARRLVEGRRPDVRERTGVTR